MHAATIIRITQDYYTSGSVRDSLDGRASIWTVDLIQRSAIASGDSAQPTCGAHSDAGLRDTWGPLHAEPRERNISVPNRFCRA